MVPAVVKYRQLQVKKDWLVSYEHARIRSADTIGTISLVLLREN